MFELVRRPDFANLPLVVEDFVKDNGGSYTGELIRTSHPPHQHPTNADVFFLFFLLFPASKEDAVHVVIDRHLITGQNVQSTLLAVNNLILLCGAK